MSKTDNVILEIVDLEKKYDDDLGHTTVLDKINLELYDGDFLCILGPSGCGKSTLIRCIAGFEGYEGTLKMQGVPIQGPGTDRIMVFQDFNQLFPWKTVKQNLAYPLKVGGMKDKAAREQKAEEYLEKVNLLPYKDYYPHQLSGGMKQRVAIAKGLALGSKIILMDEPFASLDAMTRNKMQAELVSIKEKENITVIFITHNIQEAITLGNRILVMSKNGTVKDEMDNPIQKPVTPASEGYGKLWEYLSSSLKQ